MYVVTDIKGQLSKTNLLRFLQHSSVATTKLAQNPEGHMGNAIMWIAEGFPECLQITHLLINETVGKLLLH